MKLLPERLLLSGSACALVVAASLTLPACSDTGYVGGGTSGSTTAYGSALYRVGGPYFHCHPNGVCHSRRHPIYDRSGSQYQPRPLLPTHARPR